MIGPPMVSCNISAIVTVGGNVQEDSGQWTAVNTSSKTVLTPNVPWLESDPVNSLNSAHFVSNCILWHVNQPVLMMNCIISSNYPLPARYEPFQFQHPIQVGKIKHPIQSLTLRFSLSQLYSCAAPHTNGFRLNTDRQSANVGIKECKTLRGFAPLQI